MLECTSRKLHALADFGISVGETSETGLLTTGTTGTYDLYTARCSEVRLSIPDTVGVSVQFLLNLLMIPLLSHFCPPDDV